MGNNGKECRFCKHLNPNESIFCNSCGKSLSDEKSVKEDEITTVNKYADYLQKLNEDQTKVFKMSLWVGGAALVCIMGFFGFGSYKGLNTMIEKTLISSIEEQIEKKVTDKKMIELINANLTGKVLKSFEDLMVDVKTQARNTIHERYYSILQIARTTADQLKARKAVSEIDKVITENDKIIAENEIIIAENDKIISENDNIIAENKDKALIEKFIYENKKDRALIEKFIAENKKDKALIEKFINENKKVIIKNEKKIVQKLFQKILKKYKGLYDPEETKDTKTLFELGRLHHYYPLIYGDYFGEPKKGQDEEEHREDEIEQWKDAINYYEKTIFYYTKDEKEKKFRHLEPTFYISQLSIKLFLKNELSETVTTVNLRNLSKLLKESGILEDKLKHKRKEAVTNLKKLSELLKILEVKRNETETKDEKDELTKLIDEKETETKEEKDKLTKLIELIDEIKDIKRIAEKERWDEIDKEDLEDFAKNPKYLDIL